MASPGTDAGPNHQGRRDQSEPSPEPAFREAQKWIEAVTGRTFGDKDFRGGLENGILLCELLSSIRPGLVKKINRLPTPIAGLDNLTMFLRGCEELGLKGSQLFDPGDLQDTSIRANLTGSECNRKLKNVLITIYWLGKSANCCTSYNGPTLNLKEFEGLLSQMKKESEDTESPKRCVRDSGYIDCWDSERSESLSPPRHGRDDSFDSLDSFGSRSQQTPSPDVRANSDGRGSDSEGDAPHRKLPDVRKDDMLARRTSYNEPRATVPFNQYLPNKSNQSAYVPTPLRKKRTEGEDSRKSWSTATTPVSSDRPFSHPELIQEDCPPGRMPLEPTKPQIRTTGSLKDTGASKGPGLHKTVTWAGDCAVVHEKDQEEEEEVRKMRKLEKAGIRVLPATVRYSSPKLESDETERTKTSCPDIILRQDNDFLQAQLQAWDSDEEEERKVPDVQRDDLASRRARMNRAPATAAHHFLPAVCSKKDQETWEGIRRASQRSVLEKMEKMEQEKNSESEHRPEVSIITRKDNPFLSSQRQTLEEQADDGEENNRVAPHRKKDDLANRRARSGSVPQRDPLLPLVQTSITPSDMEKWQRLRMSTDSSENEVQSAEVSIVTRNENPFPSAQNQRQEEDHSEGQEMKDVVPNPQKDDLARRRGHSGPLSHRDPILPLAQSSITQSDLEKWQRLKMNTENSESPPICQACIEKNSIPPAISKTIAAQDDLAARRTRGNRRFHGNRQRFVTFGPVTEMDQQCWERLSISHPGEEDEERGEMDESQTLQRLLSSATVAMPTICMGSQFTERLASDESGTDHSKALIPRTSVEIAQHLTSAEHKSLDQIHYQSQEKEEGSEEDEGLERQPDLEKDDMLARRTGTHQKPNTSGYNRFLPKPGHKAQPYREEPHIPQQEELKDWCRPRIEGASDWGIKTARLWKDQRTESQKQEPKVEMPVSLDGQKEPKPALTPTAASDDDEDDDYDGDEGDEYGNEDPLPDLEKDDMHARRSGVPPRTTGSAGHSFKMFLPVPGSVKYKATPSSGLCQTYPKPREQEKALAKDSSNAVALPKDVMHTASMCSQVTDREEVGSVEYVEPLKEAHTSDDPKYDFDPPTQERGTFPPRRPSWLEDDLPPIFCPKAVTDEPESMSMIDMRYEEEVILQPHSQSQHEHLHNQYNKVKEEEDHWQDDLARWKNRRRSASQDLIKKEEERKMMEKMMTAEQAYSLRRKSIKTYKEIVEEKERREQELHDAYRKARTPEEAAAVLQRYALRFTISDAILERLQIPQPREKSTVQPCPMSVDAPAVTAPSPAQSTKCQPVQESTSIMQPSVPVPIPPTLVPIQTHILAQASNQIHTQPKMTDYASTYTPAPSKPLPLLTPKPYSQPKHIQVGHKPVKVDGLVRINGEVTTENSTKLSSPSAPAPSASQEDPVTTDGPNDLQQTPAHTKPPQEPPITLFLRGIIEEQREEVPDAMQSSKEEVVSTTLFESTLKEGNQPDLAAGVKKNCVVTTTIVTELTQTQPIHNVDALTTTQMELSLTETSLQTCEDHSVSSPEQSKSEPVQISIMSSYSTTESDSSHSSGSSRLRWEFFTVPDAVDNTIICTETPILNLAKRVDHWTWDPNEERKRQERWQQEQERLLQEKYQQEQEKLKQEWEKAQKEVEEEERRHNEEEQRILEETMTPLTSRTSTGTGNLSSPSSPQDSIVLATADWDRKQEHVEQPNGNIRTDTHNGVANTPSPDLPSPAPTEDISPAQQNGRSPPSMDPSESATPQLQFIQADSTWKSSPPHSKPQNEEWKKTASLDRNLSSQQGQSPSTRMRRSGSYENILGTHPSTSSSSSPDTQPPSPSRSVSGKKLCSSCAQPLGKGAAMVIESLGLYFHIQCFKCGVCKGQLGDTSTGTDVRIRSGLLNCHDCYVKSRAAGQPTTL
ncbi:LIM and calponin homology domains-containing protein 1-like isoform X3 [Denticeps clupeoides]|uniref:LIM and calponin homology domains-containing protein 1-like isoform X3 n=1 Tax=Denticeps clupeoides TaxID=299321 RepID=UPI0010A5123A|nr:LIM and calponin homology domains-containing protein 1-like isoform X3 [Denticeps clupeoides]